MGAKGSDLGTFGAKLLLEDRQGLEAIKIHPRETFGEVVHRLLADYLADHPERLHGRARVGVPA